MKDRDAKRNMLAIAADYDTLAEQLLSQAGNKIMPITAAVRRPGRPTKYTAELGAAICRLVVTGHSQRQIAAMAGMPATSTIHRWEHAHEQFRRQHARAKELAAEMVAEHRKRALACTHPTAGLDRFHALRWLVSRLDPIRMGNEAEAVSSLHATTRADYSHRRYAPRRAPSDCTARSGVPVTC